MRLSILITSALYWSLTGAYAQQQANVSQCKAVNKILSIVALDKKPLAAQHYAIALCEDGKTLALPSVLRKKDDVFFKIPTDQFKSDYGQKIDAFMAKFTKDNRALCRDTILSLLLCDTAHIKSCLNTPFYKLKNMIDSGNSFYTIPFDKLIITDSENQPYEFRKKNLENKLISDWLRQTITTYRGFKVGNYSAEKICDCSKIAFNDCLDKTCDCTDHEKEFWDLFYQLNSINTALTLDYNSLPGKESVTDSEYSRICSIIKQADDINDKLLRLTMQVINGNREWMLSWLWYTDGVPLLNPFGTSDTTAQSLYLRSRIASLSANVAAYSNGTPQEGAQGIRQSQPIIIQLARELTFLKARLAQLPALQTAYLKRTQRLSVKSDLLYKGELYVSEPEQVIWMPQFDADQHYKKIVTDYLPDYISEKDQMRPLVINLNMGKDVVLEEKVTTLDNVTNFERALGPAFAVVEPFQNAIKVQTEKVFSNLPPSSSFHPSIQDELRRSLESIQQTLVLANWLSEQTAPPATITLTDNDTPAYRTEWVKPTEPEDKAGLVEVVYGIAETANNKQNMVVRNEKYTQYPLTVVSPAAGIVYHATDRYASAFADGKFSDEPFNRVDFVFGVKIYPWKTNIQYRHRTAESYRLGSGYNTARGNGFLNRINLFIGLGTQKVFRNYYLGAGIDLFPFLQVQAGWNWYIQKRYELSNGTIIHTQDHLANGGGYLSATLPLGVVTKLFTFINPF